MAKRKRAAAPESAEQPENDGDAPTVRKKRRKQPDAAGTGDAAAAPEPEAAPAGGAGQKKKKAGKAAVGSAAEAAAPEPEPAPADAAGKKRKKGGKAAAAADVAGAPAAENAETTSVANSEVERTVFVDGVPYDWTLEKVKECFQKCGAVESVRAPTWQDSGRLRGYAHVTFNDAAGQTKALAMDGHVIKKGRYLKIEAAKPPADAGAASTSEIAKGKRRLFVKNLPFDAKEADIASMFKKCGAVVEVRVPTASGRAKGFAYVEFAKSAGLAKALNMQPPPEMGGRRLRLDVDTGSGPKAGFHYRPEAFEAGYGKGRGGGRGDRGRGRGRGKLSLF